MGGISDIFGISRQRVQQILALYGISRNDGGLSVSSKKRAKYEKREKEYIDKHGMTRKEYWEVAKNKTSAGSSPQFAYRAQRESAKHRGIEWDFNFNDWWQVWCQSGKWEERGRMLGQYVMCRYKDAGSYSTENTYIDTCSHNISDQYLFRRELTFIKD